MSTALVPHSLQHLKAANVVLVALIVFSANSRPAATAASPSRPSRSQYPRSDGGGGGAVFGGNVCHTSVPAPVAFLEAIHAPRRPLKLSGSSTMEKGETTIAYRTKRTMKHRYRNHRIEDVAVAVVSGEELQPSVDVTTEMPPPQRQPHRCCSCRRRSLLSGIALSAAAAAAPPSLMMTIAPQFAIAAGGGAPEAIRRGAANVPGYGQPDVFYPSYFAGSWRCTRTIAASPSPITLVYEVRFLETADGGTIADRGYNRASYIRAASEAGLNPLGADAASASSGGGGGAVAAASLPPPPPLRTVDWDASNPNVLTVTFANGYVQEVRVTKRAFEASSSGEAGTGGGDASGDGMSTFFSSEYRRVTDIDGERGIPSLSGSRVLTKWKRDLTKDDVIEGIELVYYDGVLGDPMGGGGGGGSKSVTKSRLLLERS